MHSLHNMHFLTRMEKIFYSKNIPNNHEIFLHRELFQGPKNFEEFSQIFMSKENEGCYRVEGTEVLIQRKIFPRLYLGISEGKGWVWR